MRTWLALALLSCGCAGDLPAADGAGDPVDLGDRDFRTVYACDTVDVLFVIDNSDSMLEEQGNLIANFPAFITKLEAIDPPIKSYHIGVITPDIGAGPYSFGPLGQPPNCAPPGDDAKLQHQGSGASCSASYPKFLEGPGPSVATDFSCMAKLALGGCGFEQQLEATLKALRDQPYNEGFLRRNAPLAIVIISDEDDCSASDTAIFDPEGSAQWGEMSERCVNHLDKLHPMSRYVEGLRKLKDDPTKVVLAVISGPKGTVQIDPTIPGHVKPACSSDAFGAANPGNRFAELVAAFGEQGLQHSLCQGDLAPALDLVNKAIERACLK